MTLTSLDIWKCFEWKGVGVCDSPALKRTEFLMSVLSQQLFSICTFVKDGWQLMYALCLFKADDTVWGG